MFSVFYLEIITMTKLVSGKTKQDSRIGNQVNTVISAFYFFLFLLVIVVQALSEDPENLIAIEILFIKNWYMMLNPYSAYPKTQMTIFDLSMFILCVLLFNHCLMNLYIARESALIYLDEV